MKKLLYTVIVLAFLFLLGFRFYLYPRLPILNGHAAKTLCSCVFLAGIPEEKAIKEDIGFFPVNFASKKVDYDEKSVTTSFWGFRPKKAYYRDGLGCAIFNDKEPDQTKSLDIPGTPDSLANWFDVIDTVELLSDPQQESLDKALEFAFKEENPENPKLITRAAAVVYKGQLVGEKYAEGFDRNSRLLGWSMTKSITAILYGILEKEGRLALDDKVNLKEWEGTNKESLSLRHLLNMASGMEWTENYGDRSSVTIMLYESDGLGAKASEAKLTGTPGESWYYSSGTTNILSYTLSNYFSGKQEYQKFPYEKLFARLGMASMRLESDADGYYVGSSYSWATARDWAKFGLMALNDGVFAGDTIVNASWIDFVKEPVGDSEGRYGGQFWLNANGKMKDVPRDAFLADGFHSQRVLIIPSKDLVLVRLGETYFEPENYFNDWTKKVMDALSI